MDLGSRSLIAHSPRGTSLVIGEEKVARVPSQAGHFDPCEPGPMPRPKSTVRTPQNIAPSPGRAVVGVVGDVIAKTRPPARCQPTLYPLPAFRIKPCRQGYRIFFPNKLAASSTTICAVRLRSSRIGLTSTRSRLVTISASASSSISRWASR